MEEIDLRNKVVLYTDVIQALYDIKYYVMSDDNGIVDILNYIQNRIVTLNYINEEEKKRYIE